MVGLEVIYGYDGYIEMLDKGFDKFGNCYIGVGMFFLFIDRVR